MANNINCTCGHSWSKASSSKKDMYVCHICGKDNTMQDGGWLSKFEQGGMNLEQKDDNYGIKPNPNNVQASVGPDFVGLGYDTTGRNYSPAWGGQFAMGGSMPGAVGFTYARTAGSAPSNGKYAKKTKASAQNGKEMKFYQEGLDFKPNSIAQDGGQYFFMNLNDEFNTRMKNIDYVKGEYNKGMDFHNKWLNSPMYNSMINASDPVNAKQITDQRKDRLSAVRFNYVDNPYKAGASTDQLGNIEVYPAGIGNKGVGVHEMSHVTDTGPGQNLIPAKDRIDISRYSLASENMPKYEANEEYFNYVTKPSETRARLNEIRQGASENKLYDPFTQKVNPAIYNKLKNFKFNSKPGDDPLQQLRSAYSDKQILEMLNSVSKNKDRQQQTTAQDGGAIVDPMGQWAHPGEVTIIPSTDITMEGVDYPVLGISDTGDQQMMYPGEDYQFDGDYVTEYPMMKEGGLLSKYQSGGPLSRSNLEMMSALDKDIKNQKDKKDKELLAKAVAEGNKNRATFKQDNRSDWQKKASQQRVVDEYLNEARGTSPLAQTFGSFTPTGNNEAAGQIAAEQFADNTPMMNAARLFTAARDLENNQLLKGADVATDLMQIGNFIPNPVGQLFGKIGNVSGGLVDTYQAYDAYDKGDYGDVAINLASVALPMTLGSSTFRRNSKYLQPGQPLNFLKGSERVNYIEPFKKVKGMTNKSLMTNRLLLGTLGAEAIYDSYQNGGWLSKFDTAQSGGTFMSKLMANEDPTLNKNRGDMVSYFPEIKRMKDKPEMNKAITKADQKRQQQILAKAVANARDKQATVKQDNRTSRQKEIAQQQLVNLTMDEAQTYSPLAQTFSSFTPTGDNPEAGKIFAKQFVDATPPMAMLRLMNATRDVKNNPYGIGQGNGFLANTLGTLGLVGDVLDVGVVTAPGVRAAGKYLTEQTPLRNASKFNPYALTDDILFNKEGVVNRQIFGDDAYNQFLEYGPTTRPNISQSDQMMELVRAPKSDVISGSGEVFQVAKTMEDGAFKYPYFQEGSLWYTGQQRSNLAKELGKERIITTPTSDIWFAPAGESSVMLGDDVSQGLIDSYSKGRRVLMPGASEYAKPSKYSVFEPHWWKGYKEVTQPSGVATPNLGSAIEQSTPLKNISEIEATSPNVKSPWEPQELPGLHLSSTMEGGPISKIVEPKTGLVNVEQALGIIGKESGGASKASIIKKALGKDIPKKMDYNDFRKTVQDQLIPLEREVVNTFRSAYNIDKLGYTKASRDGKDIILNRINNTKEEIRGLEASGESNDYLDILKANLEIDLRDYNNLPLENQTIRLSNKDKFGRGSDVHGNPEETLGHIHFLRDAESPDILTMTQLQSDAFQSTNRTMPKSLEEAGFSLQSLENIVSQRNNVLESLKKQKEELLINKADKETIGRIDEEIDTFTKLIEDQNAFNKFNKAEVENFAQKSLLDKNHQERYLQELVDYAGKRGDVNKVRVPTSETAAKVQGYRGVEAEEIIKRYNEEIAKNPNYTKEITEKSTENEIKLINDVLNGKKKGMVYEPEAQTILKKYTEQPKLIKKLFGVEPKIVTDSKGNTWYEFDIPDKFKGGKGEIKAFKDGGWLTKYK